ncbi:hypothetical protein T439DRAFT_4590 [Meredithblackwellia eburnea MCA 4105]
MDPSSNGDDPILPPPLPARLSTSGTTSDQDLDQLELDHHGQAAPSERFKMSVACDRCRRRKVACDSGDPCARCEKSNALCSFSLPHRLTAKGADPATKRRRVECDPDERTVPVKTTPPKKSRNSLRPSEENVRDRQDSRPGSGNYKPLNESSDRINRDEHLLLIDTDDQLVCSGPSSGMPLLVKLGLIHTVEVSESNVEETPSRGNPTTSLGLSTALTAAGDCYNLILQRCPAHLLDRLIRLHMADTAVLYPLFHAPSFLSEFTAVTDRRLVCTPQYGALLMSILSVTVRLLDEAKSLFDPSEAQDIAVGYYEFARDLLRITQNKLDIRYLLTLYHLAVFAEGRNPTGAVHSGFLGEAISLGFSTGLHRSMDEWNVDPVTREVRARLFWGLYIMDVSLAYAQGRPAMIRLSECTVAPPLVVHNQYITKEGIGSSPEDPPIHRAAALAVIQASTVLEEVLLAINSPTVLSDERQRDFHLVDEPVDRGQRLTRASMRLDKIQANLPAPLSTASQDLEEESREVLFHSLRVSTTFQFIRTILSRQQIVDEISESQVPPPSQNGRTACSIDRMACESSVSITKTFAKLRHFGLLPMCSFDSVSHLAAAGHTLICCMIREPRLALDFRPDLLTAIDILLVLSERFPCAETASKLLFQLSRKLDHKSNFASSAESTGVRIMARKVNPPSEPLSTSISALKPNPASDSSNTGTLDWLLQVAERERPVPPPTETSGSARPRLPDWATVPSESPTPDALRTTWTSDLNQYTPIPDDWGFLAGASGREGGGKHDLDPSSFAFLNDGFSLSF